MSAPAIDPGVGGRVLPRPARRSRRVALAALAVMIALGVALPIFAGVVTQPVRSVRISGEFAQVSKADIERTVEPLLEPGLLRIDVEALRRVALDLPWVREVTVRRAWPEGLEISVVEREAIARWADGGYLERDGAHFRPGGGMNLDSLPVLAGPEGTQRRVLDLHTMLERVLAPLGRRLAATELTPRGVLYANLDGGPRLVMRSDAMEDEVAAHATAIAKLTADRLHEIERIDFRYPNGFAVRIGANAAGNGERQ